MLFCPNDLVTLIWNVVVEESRKRRSHENKITLHKKIRKIFSPEKMAEAPRAARPGPPGPQNLVGPQKMVKMALLGLFNVL